MKDLHRKSKMVSFRVSPDGYHRLCEACEVRGVVSVSELARIALEKLLNTSHHLSDSKLSSLEDRIRMLTNQLDGINKRLGGRTTIHSEYEGASGERLQVE